MTTTPNPWLARARPSPQARVRLFCLPYSGGGAAAFAGWADILPPEIEVCPVQLPGRGPRAAEPPLRRMDALVGALADALLPHLDMPFAIFGHSMGALVGFELARHLRARHGIEPAHLCAAAHRAPQLPDRDPPLHGLPEPELIEELRRLNGTPEEVLAHAELLQVVLPALRADFAVCETYAYADGPPLGCPIMAIGGLGDTGLERDELAAWRAQTRGDFALRMLPGDHFFIHSARQLLLDTLARGLIHLISRPNWRTV